MTLYNRRIREREGKGMGCILYLGPHSCLPHGHAVLSLTALGRGRLRPSAVSLSSSNESSVAQLLGTSHLSALHAFPTSSWTCGPFCHHPSKSKARVTGNMLKKYPLSYIWHVLDWQKVTCNFVSVFTNISFLSKIYDVYCLKFSMCLIYRACSY